MVKLQLFFSVHEIFTVPPQDNPKTLREVMEANESGGGTVERAQALFYLVSNPTKLSPASRSPRKSRVSAKSFFRFCNSLVYGSVKEIPS